MKFLIALLFLFSNVLCAQNITDSKEKNGYYLEDQLYFGVTYSTLRKKPNGINLRGFSNSFFLGYIRDIPFNKKRDFGIGIGLGYNKDTYFHDMKILKENNQIIFKSFDDVDVFNSNKLIFHKVEVPFEIRWRNSTIDDFKFWRIYTGVKFAYIFYSKASYNLNGLQKITNFKEVNKLQYGITLSAGHGTWNGFVYYGLSNLFDNAKFNGEETIKMKGLKFGMVFYLL